MKTNKKVLALFMALVIIVSFSVLSTIQSYANNARQEVSYDNCVASNYDGIDEMWYVLTSYSLRKARGRFR